VSREALLDARVQEILLIGRSSHGPKATKVHEIVQPDLLKISTLAMQLGWLRRMLFLPRRIVDRYERSKLYGSAL